MDLVKKKTANIAELRILPEQFQRKTLSLFPNGQVAEYELIYLVRYQVQKPNKEPLSFNFELSREFQDDPNNALAKERERQLILSELRVLASDRILSQLMMIQ
ncbi:LPS assembly lipoprotein LptE [Psychrosphaera sp. G1-22]|uniref:LPS assembly lipoprotein LptE n=1 Tax=Psychrosphaera algicola TaxID=3023714 RepID=A0ABT5FAI9_9GAMM|nr:LPS assembly lipoprotein LptE [Psychrosphaera sp. G1-22]MDC2888054.1 LPS assembly lipoprotein LptE [Psychrosphaera sp. G1-22]